MAFSVDFGHNRNVIVDLAQHNHEICSTFKEIVKELVMLWQYAVIFDWVQFNIVLFNNMLLLSCRPGTRDDIFWCGLK